jgi:pyruvate,water dikinase
LTDDEVLTLANWAVQIEKHYGAPQDIEWAKDGPSRGLFIVQSRPETVQANKIKTVFEEYQLKTKKQPVLQGIAVGGKIGQGKVKIISRVSKINQFKTGGVLVTRMTDPDWLPAMRLASAIVTDEGGRTCHAAIVARELGVPAIVGTGQATKILKNGQETTVDCSTGRGLVFAGQIPFKTKIFDLKKLPKIKTKIMVNVGAPETAFKTSFLPARGVGLARTEFILAEKIKIHPLALYHYRKLKTQSAKLKTTTQNLKLIEEITKGYPDKRQYFIDELAEGIAQIAAAFCPRPVILRLSDLKSNEYRALIGGELFEPQEQNPMLGWRGASRYYDPKFQPAFEMECRAIKKVREEMGLKNLWLMVPFCRTPEEGKRVLNLLAKNGLSRNNDLKVMVMAEIPSNAILADEFLKIFDGFSIGSNDLTQLVLGLDRDSGFGQKIGDERNAAVKQMISQIIKVCREKGKSVGICGDAPSTFPDFIEFLVKEGIQSISVSPDALVKTINEVAKIEKNV